MALPITEQIVQQLVTQLEGITAANGYNLTVKTVLRAPMVLQFDAHLAPIIFVEIDEEEFEYNPGKIGQATMTAFVAGGLVPADERVSTLNALAQDLNLFEYDVKRALAPGVSNKPLGGLATTLVIRRSAKDLGYLQPKRAVFGLEIEVQYRFNIDDPSKFGL